MKNARIWTARDWGYHDLSPIRFNQVEWGKVRQTLNGTSDLAFLRFVRRSRHELKGKRCRDFLQ